MSQQKKGKQEAVRLGTHGEDYGSWMSTPVFFMVGIPAALAILLAVLSFAAFRTPALGILFSGITICLIALLCWLVWIRRQYAFDENLLLYGLIELYRRNTRQKAPL